VLFAISEFVIEQHRPQPTRISRKNAAWAKWHYQHKKGVQTRSANAEEARTPFPAHESLETARKPEPSLSIAASFIIHEL